MKSQKSMKKATFYIIYLGIIAKILSFAKETLMASKIGINYKMDSYLLAFSTIMLISSLISDGMIIGIIPLLQEIQERHGINRKIRFTNNLINITGVFSFILIAIGFIGAPVIVKVFGPGFTGKELDKTILLFRIGLPVIPISLINAIFSGFLQSVHSFKGGPKGRVASPIMHIIYLLFFSRFYGLKGLMITDIVANIVQIFIFSKGLRTNEFKYFFRFDLKDRYIRKLEYYLIPILAGVGLNELNLSIDNAVASTLSEGSIAGLSFANNIIDLFLGVFIAAIVTVIFPVLSEDYHKHDEEHFKSEIRHCFHMVLIIVLPVSIILIIMAEPLVKILFQRGAFNIQASLLTSRALTNYAIGLTAMALYPLIIRAYYSIQDTKTPISIGFRTLILNGILNLFLSKFMGPGGIALSSSISITLALIYGLIDLNRKLQIEEKSHFKSMTFKMSISEIIMTTCLLLIHGAISNILKDSLINNILDVLISATISLGLYVKVCKSLNILKSY
ncbi:murein biosynthesis integral membrane protein MurJ [Tissierella sp.]|uniref:murein biosynthesis integral membrane protein MurJ n=1 Tax=Tissierella sp. TaxID=41274 RepID=UPI002865765D|nr:murein biosynthesis integral membrane protein MurJ [Tissierella sp.]MDR7857481.1 murein biosynthesis integral membrane protein MurJ [Tissierella sp.]